MDLSLVLMEACRECNAELIPEDNWAPSCVKAGARICRACKSEYDRQYNIKNKDRIVAKRKADRLVNGDKLRKQSNDWHNKNREYVSSYRKERREQRRDWLDRYKRMKGCLICKENCAACLDFHSPNGHEDYRPTHMLAANKDRIKNEVFRCVVVCANCHRKLHRGVITLPEESYG